MVVSLLVCKCFVGAVSWVVMAKEKYCVLEIYISYKSGGSSIHRGDHTGKGFNPDSDRKPTEKAIREHTYSGVSLLYLRNSRVIIKVGNADRRKGQD